MKIPIVILAVVGSAASVSMADPVMVYGQRPGAPSGYYFDTSSVAARLADDFVLAQTTNMLSVDFWAYAPDGSNSFSQTFDISVWADEGGGNGVLDTGLIHLETYAVSDMSATTVFGSATRFTATFDTPFTLGPGTYWLSIGVSDDTNYGWLTQGGSSPDPYGGPLLDYDLPVDGAWDGPFSAPNGSGLAFSLTGNPESNVVPLPTGAILGMAGLVGVAGVTRYRRRILA